MGIEENSLQPSQVCVILEACVKCGVSKLKFGPLEVEFGLQALHQAELDLAAQQSSSGTALSENQHAEQTAGAIEQDEALLKEDRLANAIIENPLLAERLIQDEELADDDEHSDGTE